MCRSSFQPSIPEGKKEYLVTHIPKKKTADVSQSTDRSKAGEEALDFPSGDSLQEQSVIARAHNPSTWEADSGNLQFCHHPQVYSETLSPKKSLGNRERRFRHARSLVDTLCEASQSYVKS